MVKDRKKLDVSCDIVSLLAVSCGVITAIRGSFFIFLPETMPNTFIADEDEQIVDENEQETVVETEQDVVETEQEDVDSTSSDDNADEKKVSKTKEEKKNKDDEEKKKEKDNIYNSMIEKAFSDVMTGAKSLDDVFKENPKAKQIVAEKVTKRQEEIKQGKSLPPETEIVSKLKVELKIDNLLEGLEEDKKVAIRNDFNLFIQNGKTVDQSFEAIKKLHDLKTDEELEKEWTSVGTRFRRSSQVSKKASEGLTKAQIEMAKRCGNDPKEVYKE